jgi:hypothetical protein
MKHKLNPILFTLFILPLIGLTLGWFVQPAQAGSGLPPRDFPRTQTGGDDDDNDEPVGAYLNLTAPDAPFVAWAIVQWQDSGGNWHDVEGWRGWLSDSSHWWVHPKDFSTGPFRWVITQGIQGPIWQVSQPFNLPPAGAKIVQVTVKP